MAETNAEAGPSRHYDGSLVMAAANPLTLPALASDLPQSLVSKRIVSGARPATSKGSSSARQENETDSLVADGGSPRAKRKRSRLQGEETKRQKKKQELERERDFLAGPETNGDPTAPSDNLLRSIHLHASEFYASQGLMPFDSGSRSDNRGVSDQERTVPVTRSRRVDMTSAIEARGLVVLGMIVQEYINDALERNGMRERDAIREALDAESRLGLEPRLEHADETLVDHERPTEDVISSEDEST